MVWVRPGTFQMGSRPWAAQEEASEQPRHRVWISKGFWLAKYEVTQAQWGAVMGNNPSSFKGDVRYPVQCVSWKDCQEFIQRLNAATGDEGGFRLPTEAEWEYACRAGSNSSWYCGNSETEFGLYAWYRKSGSSPNRGGLLGSNAWGLYDMHGNVAEWCQDWYGEDYYGRILKADPTGPAAGRYRVLRGGGYSDTADNCRSARRGFCGPDVRLETVGLRLARDADS